ncbi:hypothetical protein FSP39_001278 [Pinctada imbricata]|uniref:Insulin receptor substrate 1 n=1 Tax=Pinctada imbricata TaxID=66713 RepID=A0AA89BY69_PINIB|nr:hypothetical protein FSP39_001278 [Pinctada imbricata]
MDRFDQDNLSQRMSMVTFELPGSDIQKTGYLKKLKTNKKKYFVLRSTSSSGAARLEYYDNEKKFRANALPKRSIELYKCFNINKKSDTKVKNVIALYLKEECFAVVAEEDEMSSWLDLLLEYQHEYQPEDWPYYPHYDYIWHVSVKHRGLGGHKIQHGTYRLCLAKTCISFVRSNSDILELSILLAIIRRCGNKDCFFFMEVGRSAPTGSGEIWMQVDDAAIATGMHDVIVGAMRASANDGGPFRSRTNTGSSMVSRLDQEFSGGKMRDRSGSESKPHGSPRRRVDSKRPQTMYNNRPSSLMGDTQIFSTSPIGANRSMTPEIAPRQQEESEYLQMSSVQRSTSPSPSREKSERPDSSCSEHNSATMDGYFEMKPGSSVGSTGGDSGYLDMAPTGPLTSTPVSSDGYMPLMIGPVTGRSPGSNPIPTRAGKEPGLYNISFVLFSMITATPVSSGGYLMMGPVSGRSPGSNPIPIRAGKEPGLYNISFVLFSMITATPVSSGGYLMMGPVSGRSPGSNPIPIRAGKEPGMYMEMGPSSQPLPTVKESGSGEAYLPMSQGSCSPSFGDTENLRPAKVISYLSDDSMSGEFPKRSFSVGSRPASKSKHRYPKVPEPPPEKVSDNGRCSSAPHLIVQKMKGHDTLYPKEQDSYGKGQESPYMNESSLSCSPMSQSIRSDMSDTDSFMEMDFYRPRTASDSFGCRPRTSSFNKVFNQQRQRSSSYGQQSKLAQLAHDVRKKIGSLESVRTLSKDHSKTTSSSSVGKLSASSKTSSSESLRNASKNSGYVEMHLERKPDDGYLDMTLGTVPSKGSRSKGGHSRSSSNQSLSSSPAVTSPHRHDTISPNPSINVVKASEHVVKKPKVGSSGHTTHLDSIGSRPSGKSPAGSGRESEDESYVPYNPGNVSVLPRDSKSMDKRDTRRPSWEKRKGRNSPKFAPSGKQSPKNTFEHPAKVSEASEYVDYAPGDVEIPAVLSPQISHERSLSRDSDYVDCTLGASPAPESDYVDCDVGPKVVNSERNRKSPSDQNEHMDKRSGSLTKHKERRPSGDPVLRERKTSVGDRRNSMESTTKTSKLSAGGAEDNLSRTVPKHSENENVRPETFECGYMEYDPASAQQEMAQEVKSPNKVKSFLASTGSEGVEETKDVSEKKEAKAKSSKSSTGKKSPKLVVEIEKQKQANIDSNSSKSELNSKNKEVSKNKSELDSQSKEVSKSKQKKEKKTSGKSEKIKKSVSESKETNKTESTVVKSVAPVKMIEKVEEEDYGYVGLDYGDAAAAAPYDPNLIHSPIKIKEEPFKNIPNSKKELKNMWKAPLSDEQSPIKINSKTSTNGQGKMSPGIRAELGLPRKSSVSSLDEMKSDSATAMSYASKEKERSIESLNNNMLQNISAPELQKQLSMPCMAVPAEPPSSPAGAEGFSNVVPNRQSCSDLSSPYEEMNLPGNELSGKKSSSQQQLAPPGEQSVLNYAKLDLGSNEDVGNESKVSRVKSRHPSSVSSEETSPSPLSYAQIDFNMSENLKNATANIAKETSK